jgi:Tol biopolymer transport system component
MKKLLLVSLAAAAVVIFFVSCGSSSKSVVPSQPNAVAFLQQKAGTDSFYPVLGKFSGSQFTTSMIKDPSTGNYVSAAIGAIIPSANGDRATLEVYGGTNNVAPTNQWDIYVGTIDGANLVQITNDAYPDEVLQFNPAGTKVIFSSYPPGTESSAWVTVVRNADGTGEQVLPQPVGAQDTWHVSYSPDGSKIAVVAASEIANPPFYGITLMNADGSNATMLTNPYGADCWCADEDPYFTSDGTQIIFSREDYAAGMEDVYIMKTDGTAVTKLTDGTGLLTLIP